MATYMDGDRPLLLDNILFENLIKSSKSIHFDDTKLKRLNSILSNIPYNMLKQSYDNYQRQAKVNETPMTSNTTNSVTKRMKEARVHNHLTDAIEDLIDSHHDFLHEKSKKHREESPIMYDRANQIVIHVCDEAKQLKKDFTCPRDLLVNEMKYFSYNVNLGTTNSSLHNSHNQSHASSSAINKRSLDDMDISVHCDINIFDWLMRYVKRNLVEDPDDNENNTNVEKEPKLEVTNCVSILISSDFLIMPDLVDKCIKFMIENFNHILQMPCNMNTISDKLITRIAAFIKIQQLDELIDKKDKFKAKMFMKKIEFLFDVAKFKQQFENNEEYLHELSNLNFYDINDNDCATLFRCKICGRIMTQNQSKYIKCKLGILDKYGNYNYFHLQDEKFDINNFIIEIKERLKTWQNVYWFLWALIKCNRCQVCKEWFRFVDLNKCSLNENSECSVHGKSTSSSSSHQQKRANCICIYKDHTIDQASFQIFYNTKRLSASLVLQLNKHVIDDLIKHKDVICYGNGLISLQNINNTDGSVSFCNLIENHFSKVNGDVLTAPNQTGFTSNFFIDSITGRHISFFNKYYLNLVSLSSATNQGLASGSASSINDTNNTLNSNFLTSDIILYLKLIQSLDPTNVFNSQDILSFLKADTKKKWDQSKPARWNQDNQREDDMRRFREICNYIFKLRISYDQAILAQNNSKYKTQNSRTGNSNASGTNLNQNNLFSGINSVELPPGGFYYRIENDWKARVSSNTPAYTTQFSASSANTNASNNASNLAYANPSVSSSVNSNLNSLTGGAASTTNNTNLGNFNFLNSKANNNSSGSINNNMMNANNKLRQGAVAAISKFSNN